MACAMPKHVRTSAFSGCSKQARSSIEMYCCNSSGSTVCGSRHGIGRTRRGPVGVCTTVCPTGTSSNVVAAVAIVMVLRILYLHPCSAGLQLELGITQSAHFGHIQAFQLGFGRDALTD